ncbi:hypothetical protein LTS18_009427 [Coniosporium uncinatum]|uniref:Uncharacterized protein n=1 Tax=Coniosporium uncinatum TaxID=93489 RepID=A0ACC3DCS4_9PEZI|nr:hypothetical protein LTS18_009427 [Coniosporium uncinatum]
MNTVLSVLALAAATYAAPQGVTEDLSPSSSAPEGCSSSMTDTFSITTVNVTTSAKRSLQARQAETLQITLADGKLTDSEGRTGYIAANNQFQFDSPPQTGAIYTDGFSVCGNGSLALGGSAIWYQCYSGGFYNLYDESIGEQCSPIYIEVLDSGAAGAAPSASQAADGQAQASSAVSQISDGQPQATSAAVSQISDGQPQATSAGAVSQISDGQPQASAGAATPVTQISDGQIQATSAGAAPVTQISDGQIQATSAAPVTQISDGQIQATSAGAPVTQIADGQIQATSAGAPVSQISDGQIQAAPTNGTYATATPQAFEGAAAKLGSGAAGVIGIMAAVLAL